jgi:FixJ family two-component response regulator
VLTQVVAGKTSRETADFYGIGLRTVEFHRANVMANLGATNLTDLIVNAKRRGLM